MNSTGMESDGCSIGQVGRLAQLATHPKIIQTPQIPVGVSLLAIAVDHQENWRLARRHREQAQSCRGLGWPQNRGNKKGLPKEASFFVTPRYAALPDQQL
jgi:hypothetical protein